jgi:hypothetical protein
MDLEHPRSDASCSRHPDQAATGACGRCGRFTCEACSSGAVSGEAVCTECEQALVHESRQRDLVRQFRRMALGQVLRAIVVFGIRLMGWQLRQPDLERILRGLFLFVVPFLALGVLMWFSPRRSLPWLALVLDLIVFGGGAFFVLVLLDLDLRDAATFTPWIALLLLPVGTLLRALRIQRAFKATR